VRIGPRIPFTPFRIGPRIRVRGRRHYSRHHRTSGLTDDQRGAVALAVGGLTVLAAAGLVLTGLGLGVAELITRQPLSPLAAFGLIIAAATPCVLLLVWVTGLLFGVGGPNDVED
jgi:hypothetical protein